MLSQQRRCPGRRVFYSFLPHSHEYLPVNRRAHTHLAVQPHAHECVCLQATFRISRRYSSCSRKFKQRAHVEVRFRCFPPGYRILTTQTRHFVQNTGFVCRGIHYSLPGPVMDLGFVVQLYHEGVLHRQ